MTAGPKARGRGADGAPSKGAGPAPAGGSTPGGPGTGPVDGGPDAGADTGTHTGTETRADASTHDGADVGADASTDAASDGDGSRGWRPGEAAQAAELAERIAGAVQDVPGVAELTGGPFNRVATYRVGRPVTGVAVRADRVEVGVVVRAGAPLAETGERVRGAVAPLAGERPVDVLIGDIADEADG